MKIRLLSVDPWAPVIDATFDKLPMVLGCGDDADLRIDTMGVTPRHCEIHVEAGRLVAADLGSEGGTLINYTIISQPSPLNHGDILTIGIRSVCVSVVESAPAAKRRMPRRRAASARAANGRPARQKRRARSA